MRKISLILGCAALLCVAQPLMGTLIPFTDSPQVAAKEASLGISINLTGLIDVPQADGGWEVFGATSPFRDGSPASRFYSGTATFGQSISHVTLDVMRANNSGWKNTITVTAFDQGKKVATEEVDLKPLGDGTRITLSAPAIDSLSWEGEGWVFHPYYVTGMELNTAARSVGGGISTPSVGTPVPEPATMLGIAFLAISLLGRHRKI